MNIKKSTLISIGLLALAFVSVELIARLWLGTPPLFIRDSDIEYLLKPNQKVIRYQNLISTNSWTMRSDPIQKTKKNVQEYRVLIVGDSVVNGVPLLGHGDLATTLLQEYGCKNQNKNKNKKKHQQLVVGNISAGSWGPANQREYFKKFGFFDADQIILVISSHDAFDRPTFEPLNSYTHPQERPLLAAHELIFKIGKPRLAKFLRSISGTSLNTKRTVLAKRETAPNTLKDLEAFFKDIKQQGIKLSVIQHWETTEQQQRPFVGHNMIYSLSTQYADSTHQFKPDIEKAYTDNIHLSKAGNNELSKLLHQMIEC